MLTPGYYYGSEYEKVSGILAMNTRDESYEEFEPAERVFLYEVY